MDFLSGSFVAFVSLAIMLVRWPVISGVKSWVMLILNSVFIFSLAGSLRGVIPVVLFLSAGYACVYAVRMTGTTRVTAWAVAVIIALFVYLKRYSVISFVPGFGGTYMTVGLSYMLFRTIELIVDTRGGAVKGVVSLTEYLNYNCFFLSYISGPIQRFESFRSEFLKMGNTDTDSETIYLAFSRMINGYFKVAVFSVIFSSLHGKFVLHLFNPGVWNSQLMSGVCLIGSAFLYTVYLYLNFSGYMDIVIGAGKLMGFELPENFNGPFASSGFLELWSRWHITLSTWFKAYVFNPVMKMMAYRWPDRRLATYYAAIGFFITFMLMGIWHGTTLSFVVFGIFLGAGVSLNKLYEVFLRNVLGKRWSSAINKNQVLRLINSGLTFSYFSIGLICVWMKPDDLIRTLSSNGVVGLLAVFIAGAILASVTMGAISIMKRVCTSFFQASLFLFLKNNFIVRQSWLSLKALIIVMLIIARNYNIPDFIYKAF